MIYASVPWARSFLQFLRESGFLPWLEATLKVLLLGGLLGLIFWLLPRGKKAFPFLFFGLFLFWWTWRLPYPEEKIHLFEYVGLGFLATRVFGSWPKALAFVFLAGVGDEVFQYFWPNRVFDLRDIFLNTISGGGGVWFGSSFSSSWPFRPKPKN